MDKENNFSCLELEQIRKKIEKLDIASHIEIAKLLKLHKVKLMENNNGIFINLNNLSQVILNEILNYIDFIRIQENVINLDEARKNNLENIYFKNNKDIMNNIY
jgi:DNA-binding cell septation regulator SpoVG